MAFELVLLILVTLAAAPPGGSRHRARSHLPSGLCRWPALGWRWRSAEGTRWHGSVRACSMAGRHWRSALRSAHCFGGKTAGRRASRWHCRGWS